MLQISKDIIIPDNEIELSAILSKGAGGQHVNKVSTAIHLRFDINASSLPENYKNKLLKLSDSRISNDGIIILKAQKFRSQEKNKAEAFEKLKDLILKSMLKKKTRIPTKPHKGAKEKRLHGKTVRSDIKKGRKKVSRDD